jgi:hypothetical protein
MFIDKQTIQGGQQADRNEKRGSVDATHFMGLAGVKEVIPVTKPYKLVSREIKQENTVVKITTNPRMPSVTGPSPSIPNSLNSSWRRFLPSTALSGEFNQHRKMIRGEKA